MLRKNERMGAMCQALTQGGAAVLARVHVTALRAGAAARRGVRTLRDEERGQGTTEYAILVGVLVVIAIVAIVAFRGRIQSLWASIASAFNGLLCTGVPIGWREEGLVRVGASCIRRL